MIAPLPVCTKVAYNFSAHGSSQKWDNVVVSTPGAEAEPFVWLEPVAGTSYFTLPESSVSLRKLTSSPYPPNSCPQQPLSPAGSCCFACLPTNEQVCHFSQNA